MESDGESQNYISYCDCTWKHSTGAPKTEVDKSFKPGLGLIERAVSNCAVLVVMFLYDIV